MNTKRLLWIAAAIFLVSGTANAALVLTLDDPSTSGVDLRIEDQDSNDTSPLPGIVGVSSTTIGGVPVSTATGISKPADGSVFSPGLSLAFQSGSSTGGGLLIISVTDTDFNANIAYKATLNGGTGGTLQLDFFGDSKNKEFGKSFDIGSTPILTPGFSPQIFQSAANQVGSLTISADIGFTSSFKTTGFQSMIEAIQSIDKFVDVPPGYWAEKHIYAIYNAGITKGCSQNPLMYCPKRDVTRGQMAAFIVRADEGEPPADYCDNGSPFSDVPSSYVFCKYIKRLSELGITQGCGGGNYCPKTTVTREQMAAFLVRAVEGEPPANYCAAGSPFSDVSPSAVFCKHIKRLSELEITKGCGGGKYCPKTTVKRDQMAVFLGRAFLGMD